jgi:tRNA(fMet)-specific endonuclease VapC
MNGRLFLDTNAIIALMSGNYTVLQLVNSATWIGVSVISEIEFLSFSKISERDKALFQKFKERVEVIDLQSNNEEYIKEICERIN